VPIPFFGPAQTDAFIPALGWFLVATALVAAPVILGPLLLRRRSGRALVIGAFVLAAVAIVPGVLAAAQGFRLLGDEHTTVQRTLAGRYGLDLPAADVSSLLEGGTVGGAGTPVASATGSTHLVHLQEDPAQPGNYVPVQAAVGPLPAR
jgi:hypothetical protein